MPGFALLFAVAALTVKQDGAELRESCEPGEPVVAKLTAGATATVRFAMNGCYAVDVAHGGQVVRGFLPGAELAGIEAWELARRNAPSVDTPTSLPDKSSVPGTQSRTICERHDGQKPLAVLPVISLRMRRQGCRKL